MERERVGVGDVATRTRERERRIGGGRDIAKCGRNEIRNRIWKMSKLTHV